MNWSPSAHAHGVDGIDLNDLVARDAIAASPSAIATAKPPLCIDEYQYVPDVLDAIKARLDRARTPKRHTRSPTAS